MQNGAQRARRAQQSGVRRLPHFVGNIASARCGESYACLARSARRLPTAEIVAAETTSRVTQLRRLGVMSAIALPIDGVGIHGLLAFAVSERSRDSRRRAGSVPPRGRAAKRIAVRRGADRRGTYNEATICYARRTDPS